jgi:DNA-binding NarL/FixJ family response regulator
MHCRYTDILVMYLTSDVRFAVLSELKSAAAPGCKIVLWANTISTEMAYQAMKLGVRGILRRPDVLLSLSHQQVCQAALPGFPGLHFAGSLLTSSPMEETSS